MFNNFKNFNKQQVNSQSSDTRHKNLTESIYDSNRMYEAILNNNNNQNKVPLYQTEYLEDEPQNSKQTKK